MALIEIKYFYSKIFIIAFAIISNFIIIEEREIKNYISFIKTKLVTFFQK